MPLTITYLDGPRQDTSIEFGDDVEQVLLGRDPERCQVVLPPDLTMVGREHCSIIRSSGRYFLELGPDRAVRVNDELVEGGRALPMACELQLGPRGPRLGVLWEKTSRLEATTPQEIDQDELERRESRAVRGTELDALASTAGSTRRVTSIVGMVVLLLLVLVPVIYIVLQGQVGEVDRKVAGLDRLERKYEAMSDAMATSGAGLQDMLARAAESTYLVVYQGEEGKELGFGTAWVVGPGALATNAHVAEKFEQIPDTGRIVVRSGSRAGSIPVDHRVESISIHPGYGEFADLWKGYVPVRLNALKNMEHVRSAGSGCDIAILRVTDAENLAPALPLADASTQASRVAGEPVGYVGYPMEGMAVEGVNLQRPSPQVQVGRITAITSDFNISEKESYPGELNTLLQHSLPATGGASGSPLINSKGQVVGVLSAVNFAMLGKKRIPTGVGVNFAQRANLVGEVLEGRTGMHATRSTYWSEEIEDLYASGRVAQEDPDLDILVAGWESMIGSQEGADTLVTSSSIDDGLFSTETLHASPLVLGSGDDLGIEMYAREIELSLEGGNNYLLAAESDGPVELELLNEDGSLSESIVINELIEVRPGLKAISFSTTQPGTVRGRILVGTEAGHMSYSLHEAQVTKVTPEIALNWVKEEWLRSLKTPEGGTPEIVEVGQWTGSIDTPHGTLKVHAARQLIELEDAGPYLLAAMSDDKGELDMRLLRGDADDVIAEDDADDWYPCIAFDASGRTDLEAELFSPKAGASYRIWLFKTR